MLPHTHTHKNKNKKIIVICENSVIPKASPAPNGSIEEKLKSRGKCPNTPPKKGGGQFWFKSS